MSAFQTVLSWILDNYLYWLAFWFVGAVLAHTHIHRHYRSRETMNDPRREMYANLSFWCAAMALAPVILTVFMTIFDTSPTLLRYVIGLTLVTVGVSFSLALILPHRKRQ